MDSDRILEDLTAATADHADTRRRRYRGISDALATGHPQHVVATAAGMSPSALSRMIRQDAARPPDARLLPDRASPDGPGRRIDAPHPAPVHSEESRPQVPTSRESGRRIDPGGGVSPGTSAALQNPPTRR